MNPGNIDRLRQPEMGAAKSQEIPRQPSIVAVALIAGSVLLFFMRQLGSPNNFLYGQNANVSDLTITFWPNIKYIRDSIRTFGQLPLWRSLIFSGSPFDVDPQSGLWYPPNIIHLFVPAIVGINLLVTTHAVFAGVGMWKWARSTGTSSAAALLAAIAYAFVPKSYAHLATGHLGLFYAASYVPWVLWSAYQLGLGKWRFAGAFALTLGWQFIAHPQLAFYTGLVGGFYWLAVFASRGEVKHKEGSYQPVLTGMLMAVLLTASVSAVQLLPMLRFAPMSARASMSFEGSAVSSLPWRYLWGLILADQGGFMDYVLYVGAPILALSLFAIPRRQGKFWWGFVLFALVYSLGTNTPLYGLAYKLVPALTWLRAPSRIWFIASAALAIMAAWGLDYLLSGIGLRLRRICNMVWVAVGMLSLSIFLGYRYFFGRPPADLLAIGLIFPSAALAFLLWNYRIIPQQIFITLLFTVAVADLWMLDGSFIEGRAPEVVFADNGLAEYLSGQNSIEPFRVYSPSYSMPRHIAAEYGLETADGIDPLYLESYDRFMEVASGVKRQGYGVTVPGMAGEGPIELLNQGASPNLDLLGLLNVKYIAAEFPMSLEGLVEVGRFGSAYLYENRKYLPRSFVVGNVKPVDDFDEALAFIQSHDVFQEAAVETGRPLVTSQLNAEITWVLRSPNKLVLNVMIDQQGFLVISQSWYPDWRAEVDGYPTNLYRANAILCGVYLDAGEHIIKLVYEPPNLIAGIILSIFGIAASLLILLKRQSN